MQDFLAWMNETPWSIALRESFFVWPLIEATHVLTIMLFVGTIFMVDLRLLGLAFRKVAVSEITSKILPWTIAGFGLMVITGLLLFYAKPLVYYHNLFFRLKLLILIVAMGNILFFHKRVQSGVNGWDLSSAIPKSARASAVISICSWILIVVAGRMIAYDWFDCEKLEQGGLLNSLASCPNSQISMLVTE